MSRIKILSPDEIPSEPPETEASVRPWPWATRKAVMVFLIALAAISLLFLLVKSSGSDVQPAQSTGPIEVSRTAFSQQTIVFTLRNTTIQPATLSAININSATWPFTAAPGATIPPGGSVRVTLDYHWLPGVAYDIDFFTADSSRINVNVTAGSGTSLPPMSSWFVYLLIGIVVGIVPVFLGLLWMPPLFRRLGAVGAVFLMAITLGLLIFLGIDTANTALEQALAVVGPSQAVGLVGIGGVLTFLLLASLAHRFGRKGSGAAAGSLGLAFVIAIGIGLHNLAESFAIGVSYTQGALMLGVFAVVSIILQNLTDAMGIVLPILDEKLTPGTLAILGLIGGGPAVIGGLLGGMISSSTLVVVMLSIGAGAMFEVAYEIAGLIRASAAEHPRWTVIFAGITTGIAALYFAGLFVK